MSKFCLPPLLQSAQMVASTFQNNLLKRTSSGLALPSSLALNCLNKMLILTNQRIEVDHNYMWNDIQKLGAKEALENADSFAYFGLLAKLADRKFILSKDSAKATSGELENDANYIQKRRRRRSLGGLLNERLHPRALVELVGKMG